MFQLCATEKCSKQALDRMVFYFDRQDAVFEVFMCATHGETFRNLAGEELTDDVGNGVSVFKAELIS